MRLFQALAFVFVGYTHMWREGKDRKEINLGLGLTLIPAKQIRPKYGRSTVMFARRFPNVRSGSRTAHFFRHRSLTTPSANFSFIKVYTRQQLPQQVSATRHFQSCSIRRGSSFTNILADDNPPPVQVTSITEDGIQLADGLLLPSSCIFLEGKVFLWNAPQQLQSWSPEHFEVFDVVVPKPEILILGTGKTLSQPPPLIRQYLNKLGIQLEVMDTRNACSTYNLLSEEGRRVAAALLPITNREWQRTTVPGI